MDAEQAVKLIAVVDGVNRRFARYSAIIRAVHPELPLDLAYQAARAGVNGFKGLHPHLRFPDVTERERYAYWLGRVHQAALDAPADEGDGEEPPNA